MLRVFREPEGFSPDTAVTNEDASPTWQDDSRPGRKLIDYMEPKVHHLLKQRDWERVIVVGKYARGGKNIASESERRGKGFNWQRPTAEIIDDDTIQINCFPSENYVKHHAKLIAKYFKFKKLRRSPVAIFISIFDRMLVRHVVDASLSSLDIQRLKQNTDDFRSHASDIFDMSNLRELGKTEIIVLGYLDTCPDRVIDKNPLLSKIKITDEGKQFSWHKYHTPNGTSVAYLGCAHALWGQCVSELMNTLRNLCSVQRLLYVGKAGSLNETIASNEYLATGNVCDVDASLEEHFKTVTTQSSTLFSSDSVQRGDLVSVASPLCEDEAWYEKNRKKYRWVDCETAYIARALHFSGVDFAYLHVVSDNLGKQYSENLANEDDEVVQDKRTKLFEEIDRHIEEYVQDYERMMQRIGTEPARKD